MMERAPAIGAGKRTEGKRGYEGMIDSRLGRERREKHLKEEKCSFFTLLPSKNVSFSKSLMFASQQDNYRP